MNTPTNCMVLSIKLPEDVFVKTTEDIDTEEIDDTEVTKIEELAEILNKLSEYKFDSDDDIEGQIRRFSGVDTEAMSLALEYYNNTCQGT